MALLDLLHLVSRRIARQSARLPDLHVFPGAVLPEHLVCERDGGRSVVGVPAMGCAFWEREPRADGE